MPITLSISDGVAPQAVQADSHGRFTISKLHTAIYDIVLRWGDFFEWPKTFSGAVGHPSEIPLCMISAPRDARPPGENPRKKIRGLKKSFKETRSSRLTERRKAQFSLAQGNH